MYRTVCRVRRIATRVAEGRATKAKEGDEERKKERMAELARVALRTGALSV